MLMLKKRSERGMYLKQNPEKIHGRERRVLLKVVSGGKKAVVQCR